LAIAAVKLDEGHFPQAGQGVVQQIFLDGFDAFKAYLFQIIYGSRQSCGASYILGAGLKAGGHLGVAGFLAALVGQIILVAIAELFNRIVYEAVMLGVITARNTIAIKNKLEGNEKADASGAASPAPDPAPVAPVAPAPAAPAAPEVPVTPVTPAATETPVIAEAPITSDAPEASVASEAEAADPTAVMPEVVSADQSESDGKGFDGHFCPFCGAEAAPDSHFCGSCGRKLD
jgi:hypothetical protein